MKIVGLDFGTTNSILSYYNEKNHHVETYKMGGVDGENYIPSVVAIDKHEVLIGQEAKSYIGDDSFTLYSKFKILLGEESEEKLREYQYDKKSPQEIAKIYIDELIKKYKKDNHIDKLDAIVVTVPEIWLKDDHLARSRLIEIIKELNLPLRRLVSEPIAAGAYFLHNFKEKNKKSFNGNVLIFDYGGGTLDITLLETKDDTIKVLERSGKGKDIITLGRAGVAYDDMVISYTLKKYCNTSITKSNVNYYETLDEFENSKIKHKTKIDRHLSRYLQNSKINREVFKLSCLEGSTDINRVTIYPSDLVEPFELLEQDIFDSLKEIKNFLNTENINIDSGENFRVVMVGGFSSFYLSQRAVRNFFNSKTENDSRFESYFSDADMALAISKGASLIAKNIISIDETYPLTVQIPIYQLNIDGHYEEKLVPIFTKGERVKTYNVEYLKEKISKAGTIILVFNDGSGDISFKEDSLKAELLFPNINKPNNRWQLGFSIDKNSFVYLHIKDSTGEVKITELGDLIRKFREKIIAI